MIDLPKIPDARGNLTFIEGLRHIPFEIQRAFWIYDVPGGECRGGHSYYQTQELIVALSGSFCVMLDDGQEKKRMLLNRSYFGLYIPRLIWRHLEDFSTNAVCLILASTQFSEEDYIRDYGCFLDVRHDTPELG